MASPHGPLGRGLLAALMVLAGCAGPEYTYVTNSTDHTYLKVPNSWRPIDPKAIDAALGLDTTVKDSERGLWLAGYDADATPVARPPLRRVGDGARHADRRAGRADERARVLLARQAPRPLLPRLARGPAAGRGRPDVRGQRHQRDERRGAHARRRRARRPHRVPLPRRGRSAAGDGPDRSTSTTTRASSTCSSSGAPRSATSSAKRRSPAWCHRSPSGRSYDRAGRRRPRARCAAAPGGARSASRRPPRASGCRCGTASGCCCCSSSRGSSSCGRRWRTTRCCRSPTRR